jgi:Flp pilus assembly protein TadG
MTRRLGIRRTLARRQARRRPRRERGTMALEMAILAPVLLVLFMFLLACGRYFQTSSLLESAARDGARSASQSRSLAEAQGRVDEAVSSTMSQAVKSCQETASGTITTAFTAGTPLSVEVTCTINYRDLGLLGLGGDTTITKRFTSSLDPYRGVRDGS